MVLGAMVDQLQSGGAHELVAYRARKVVRAVMVAQLRLRVEELHFIEDTESDKQGIVYAANEAMHVILPAMLEKHLRTVLHDATDLALLLLTAEHKPYHVLRLCRIGKNAAHVGLKLLPVEGSGECYLLAIHSQLHWEHALRSRTNGAYVLAVLLGQVSVEAFRRVVVRHVGLQEDAFILLGKGNNRIADGAPVGKEIQKPLFQRLGVKMDGVLAVELKSVFIYQHGIGLLGHHGENGSHKVFLRSERKQALQPCTWDSDGCGAALSL